MNKLGASLVIRLSESIFQFSSSTLRVDFSRLEEACYFKAILKLRRSGTLAPYRKVFTTPLLTEANKRHSSKQFTNKKPRCQRGGVRRVVNQNM